MKSWFAVCNSCSAGTSVVCMGSMGAAIAVGAVGATSVAGMGGMAAMADTTALPAAATAPFLTRLLEQAGLGLLNQVPDSVLRPVFIVLLLVSLGTAYGSFRSHRRPHALLLTAFSGAVLYASIYIWMNELLYSVGFAGMLGAAVWGLVLAKGVDETAPKKEGGSR